MKNITLIGGTESTARVLSAQLAEYLEGRVEIATRWIDGGGLTAPDETELVIISSSLTRDELAQAGLLPPGLDPIVARRTVDCDALDAVVALPRGAKVLFVNDRPETARDCIASLVDLGLDAVDWMPWYPGAPPPPPAYDIAAVAGERGLVPPSIGRIIDIGVRVLDFGTIAEVFARLGLPETEIGRFSKRYLAKIVSLARRLAKSTEEARRISGHLGSVIDSLRNGILVYDSEGLVSVCNEELRGLLDLRSGELAGATLPGLVRSRELLEFLECRCGEDTGVFKTPNGSMVVRRFDLGDGGHTVATFRDERDAAEEASRLAREYRRRGHVAKWAMDDIVGGSEALLRAKRIAARLAATDLSILINGESGTGKELFASAIHAASARASGPFLAVDLGALSDDLIESELFGYHEGAFTGAKKGGKAGLFELADGGTLFLDEIGNISPKVQKRLLRVLQEKEIMRVGGSEIKRVDVRVIAATNEELLARAKRGEFREDLYFRLKMGWLRIPPLRERREDIPLLVDRFLAAEGARGVEVDDAVISALVSRDWPGNVRELRNALTYMLAVRREKAMIDLEDLLETGYFAESSQLQPERYDQAARLSGLGPVEPEAGTERGPRLDADERFILSALAKLSNGRGPSGRDGIAALAASRGYRLGPGSVRAKLPRLVELGLVVTRRGRRGTELTEAGRRVAALPSGTGIGSNMANMDELASN